MSSQAGTCESPIKDEETKLTPRQQEILQRIADGQSNKAVARDIHLATETVKSHVRDILAKLNANNRTHAVTIAWRAGLIR